MSETLVEKLPIPSGAIQIRNRLSANLLSLTSFNTILSQSATPVTDLKKWTFTERPNPSDPKADDPEEMLYSISNLGKQGSRLGWNPAKANDPPSPKLEARGVDRLVVWKIIEVEYTTNLFTIAVYYPDDPNLALVLEDSVGTPGVNLNTHNGNAEQQWEFVIVPQAPAPTTPDPARVVKATVSPGVKYIIRNWHEALVVSIGNKGADPKATDQIYLAPHVQTKNDPKSTVGQIWTFNAKPNGKFEVYNNTSRRYLAVTRAQDVAYKEVPGSTVASEWFFNSVGGFAWTITSASTGLALTPGKGKPSSGVQVYLAPPKSNYMQNQVWFIEELDEDADNFVPGQTVTTTPGQVGTGSTTTTSPSANWNFAVTARFVRLRNKGTNQALTAMTTQINRFGVNHYPFQMMDPSGNQQARWELAEIGTTKEYTLRQTWSGGYAYSSDGYVYPTNDTTMRLCFAQADTGSVYISFTTNNSPRKVMAVTGLNQYAPILDFKPGDVNQMWIIEAVS